MIRELRAEFRKVLTIRSTYLIAGIGLALLCLVSYYFIGYKTPAEAANPLFSASTMAQTAPIMAIFGGVIALLLMAHEYRYNTINYSLTLSNRRSKVLAAKIVTVIVLMAIFSAIGAGLTLVLTAAGAKAAHGVVAPQDINYWTYFAKFIYFSEGHALAALVIAALVRNMVGAFAIFFIFPSMIENLLSLLLKQHSVYLPFMALQEVIAPQVMLGSDAHTNPMGSLTAMRGGEVFLGYLIIAWIIAWVLFLRRDAS